VFLSRVLKRESDRRGKRSSLFPLDPIENCP
jgi:hypothetical protein